MSSVVSEVSCVPDCSLTEGLTRYSALHAQKIAPLRQSVSEFVMARDIESQLILAQLIKDIAQFQDAAQHESVWPNVPGGVGAELFSVAPVSHSAAANPNRTFEPASQLYQMNSPPAAVPVATLIPRSTANRRASF
jgi:hypothetical protein